MREINALPLSQSKSNPDPKFEAFYSPDPIQNQQTSLLSRSSPIISAAHTPGPSLSVISHPLNPNWCQNAAMANVDRLRLLGLSCIKNAGYFPRYSAINSFSKRSLTCINLPSALEPVGLTEG